MSKPKNKFRQGDIAVISEIKSKPHWNGEFCIVMKYVSAKQRFQIKLYNKLSNKEETVGLKPDNLSIIYTSKYKPQYTICRNCSGQSPESMLNGMKKTSEMLDCNGCKSIFFCSPQCMHTYQRHPPSVCKQYKQYALKEHRVVMEIVNLFQFDNIMSEDPCEWLRKYGLHNKGIWKTYCGCNNIPFGTLKLEYDRKFWGFGRSNKYKSWMPSFNEQINKKVIIQNWDQYYKLKKLSLESP
eukprot:254031_1